MEFAREIEPLLDSMPTNRNGEQEYLKAILRKYVHILDKGLNRPDFEPGHSKQWYEAAVVVLNKLGNIHDSDPSVDWAKEKIAEYERRQINPVPSERNEINYISEDECNTLMRIIRGRRSVRNYANRPIEMDKLKIIIEAVNWSPTSCNRQPAKVFISTNQELVKKCVRTCAGATCFSGFSGDDASFISFCADMRVYNLPEEFLLPNLDIGLGIQNCLLVAHALGISITLLTWAQATRENDKRLRALLSIPAHYRIIVNALMGYPSEIPTLPARKPLRDTLKIVSSSKRGAS